VCGGVDLRGALKRYAALFLLALQFFYFALQFFFFRNRRFATHMCCGGGGGERVFAWGAGARIRARKAPALPPTNKPM
jgi:hypothetical protein